MDSINWHTFFFLLFALAAAAFAVAVVVASNVVRMAFYLIMSLGATAGLFFLAGADFVGAMQLMIYVGGTLVLLIFGVMLTAQAPFVSMKTTGSDWILAVLVSGLLLLVLVPALFSVSGWRNERTVAAGETATPADPASATSGDSARLAADAVAEPGHNNGLPAGGPIAEPTATRLGMGLLGVRVDRLGDEPGGLERGRKSYLLAFEIVSVHLLVVLVGAAYLARTKRCATG